MSFGSLMKVKSIAECSPWSILQYFWPALSDNWFWKPIVFFLRVAVLHRFYCTSIIESTVDPDQMPANLDLHFFLKTGYFQFKHGKG